MGVFALLRSLSKVPPYAVRDTPDTKSRNRHVHDRVSINSVTCSNSARASHCLVPRTGKHFLQRKSDVHTGKPYATAAYPHRTFWPIASRPVPIFCVVEIVFSRCACPVSKPCPRDPDPRDQEPARALAPDCFPAAQPQPGPAYLLPLLAVAISAAVARCLIRCYPAKRRRRRRPPPLG